MIYLDTSVALAQLLAEDRIPPVELWRETLVSSRLLEYEIWNRVDSRRLTASHGEAVRALLARVSLLELAPPVLSRALEPFPTPPAAWASQPIRSRPPDPGIADRAPPYFGAINLVELAAKAAAAALSCSSLSFQTRIQPTRSAVSMFTVPSVL